jgi:TPR repeat protein
VWNDFFGDWRWQRVTWCELLGEREAANWSEKNKKRKRQESDDSRTRMPLENVTADASLERNEYHKLDIPKLDKLDDAEALYQRGDRTMHGINIEANAELGWSMIIEAAHRGHAVALGVCFLRGKGVEKNEARAFELFRASADRGHASGTRSDSHFTVSLFSQLNF